MSRHPISRTQPPLVIAGMVWRRWLIGARIVTITLPLVNFGRRARLDPTITVTLKGRPRGVWK